MRFLLLLSILSFSAASEAEFQCWKVLKTPRNYGPNRGTEICISIRYL
jgi:hypothetical protein